ncbi:MAG: hypothetical protein JWN11_1783 [Hyphomicrobiales bacterium]|nr:hypothetical protein [Hyphomicrobiales bacterium]
MKRFLGFFSLTSATQLCLLANQLLLLPLQLRIWGQETTAHWFVVLAIANLASVADLGLRNAAHVPLLATRQSLDAEAGRAFRGVWALTRLFFLCVTMILIAAHVAMQLAARGSVSWWEPLLILTLALDTLLIVRGIWLDSLGHFNKVEAVFLAMVTSRVFLSIAALTAFESSPELLACIYLCTGVGAVAGQAYLFREVRLLRLFSRGFGDIGWSTFATIPLVASEPALNWLRLNLPVLVLAGIADPLFVTSYVALRAIFGIARQVTSQSARYASIIYVRRVEFDPAGAGQTARLAILAATLVGAATAGLAIADHGRMLRLWLLDTNPAVASNITASLAVAVAAIGYQVINAILTREGKLKGVAKRNYIYIVASLAAAGGALLLRSITIYLVLLALQEALIALLYARGIGRELQRFFGAYCLAAMLLLTLLWLAVALDPLGTFSSSALSAITTSIALGLFPAMAIAAGALPLELLRSRRRQEQARVGRPEAKASDLPPTGAASAALPTA